MKKRLILREIIRIFYADVLNDLVITNKSEISEFFLSSEKEYLCYRIATSRSNESTVIKVIGERWETDEEANLREDMEEIMERQNIEQKERELYEILKKKYEPEVFIKAKEEEE